MDSYVMTSEESERINVLKVWMCIFVLFIHAYSINVERFGNTLTYVLYQITFLVSRIICDCAVPVFMIISAILLYRKPIRYFDNCCKKVKTLLKPYLIFNTLYLVEIVSKLIIKNEEVPYQSLSDLLILYIPIRK